MVSRRRGKGHPNFFERVQAVVEAHSIARDAERLFDQQLHIARLRQAVQLVRTPTRGRARAPTAPEMVLIAVEGCCHGELDNIYASVEQLAAVHGTKIDVLLICGDFQAVRNQADLATMACPVKYRDMRTFYKYYSGEAVAPVLTIFIGGNHEASNHNWELYHGGWVAPNIYFLGYAGVVNVGGVRIAGSSGIFNGRHYQMGHYEKPPFDDDAVRSAYHVRELEVRRLLQL